MSQTELVRQWNQMIDGAKLPAGAADVIRERYQRGGVFERPCPHHIARVHEQVSELAARRDYDEAIKRWKTVCDAVPAEPQYRMELARLYNRAGLDELATQTFATIAADDKFAATNLQVRATLELVNMAAEKGEIDRARSLLEAVKEIPVEADLERLVATELFVMRYQGQAASALRDYLFPGEVRNAMVVRMGHLSRALALEPDNPLVHYLIGRNLAGLGVPDDSTGYLRRALNLGLPHPLLARECASLLASEAYQAGDLESVEMATQVLLDSKQPEMTRLLGADWLERVHWKRTGKIGPRITPNR